MKQWILVIMASCLLLSVWGLIIFQLFTNDPISRTGDNLSDLQRDLQQKSKQGLIEDWNSGFVEHKQTEQVVDPSRINDLRDVDFGDVDSRDGIPIDTILSRLGLNEED
ncbi:hypothetical protein [Desertibacillus haloalkaliphilus]|uniref:hypothetical protein n=1 Tax=Desertibacillus haloalkaliphilus TaxID=1328930 RepID=UPI001C25EFE2|nr:hypothetical protein [Desertibacillus haloalkaliphilus]MBU8907336.1 hypothetical protein [Desertibacillus haloalkaliphilus]